MSQISWKETKPESASPSELPPPQRRCSKTESFSAFLFPPFNFPARSAGNGVRDTLFF